MYRCLYLCHTVGFHLLSFTSADELCLIIGIGQGEDAGSQLKKKGVTAGTRFGQKVRKKERGVRQYLFSLVVVSIVFG